MNILRGENGIAILQVVFVGFFVTIAGLLFMQFMDSNEKKALSMIRRNQNLNYSIDMASFINDREFVKNAASALQSNAGVPIPYQ